MYSFLKRPTPEHRTPRYNPWRMLNIREISPIEIHPNSTGSQMSSEINGVESLRIYMNIVLWGEISLREKMRKTGS